MLGPTVELTMLVVASSVLPEGDIKTRLEIERVHTPIKVTHQNAGTVGGCRGASANGIGSRVFATRTNGILVLENGPYFAAALSRVITREFVPAREFTVLKTPIVSSSYPTLEGLAIPAPNTLPSVHTHPRQVHTAASNCPA